MKKKVVIIVAVVILVLGISGTCAGLVWKNSNQEQEQKKQTAELEKDTDKKTVDNKKSGEKETDETVLSNSETGVVETATSEKAVENPALNEETSEKATDSSTNSPVENTTNENHNNNSSSTPSGNHNNNSSSTPTGNTSSGESGNSSGNGTNSSSGNSSNNNTPTQPIHTHTWVHVDATGHNETVTIQAAWDEVVPVYENVAHDICNQCGVELTEANIDEHYNTNIETCWAWHTEWRYEQTGTQTIHHDAVTENRWVQDSPAYDVCSGCGATK